jgi:hypothetical protein
MPGLDTDAFLVRVRRTNSEGILTPAYEQRGDCWLRVMHDYETPIEVCPTRVEINGAPAWQPYRDSVPATILARLYLQAKQERESITIERDALAERLALVEAQVTALQLLLENKKTKKR